MKLLVLIAAAGSMVLMGACTPDLAETPLTPEETQWKEYLKDNYPGWRAPQTVYPTSSTTTTTAVTTAVDDDETMTVTGISGGSGENTGGFQMVEEKVYDDGSIAAGSKGGSAQTASYVTYKVQKGDTLTGIAHKHYKKASCWKRIYNANANVISNPNKLKPGMVLQIPQ